MAITRFDRAGPPKDWSFQTAIPKLPELDIAGLEAVIQQNQQRIDQVGLLSEKTPNRLQTDYDLEIYNDYKKRTDQGLNDVTEAFKVGPAQGNMAYNKFLNQTKKDWRPGGAADLLNSRYNSYNAAVKATDDFYKDDSNPVNKTLAKHALAEQLKKPIDYDPVTGSYTQITTPELYKNPNLNDAVNKLLSEMEANGTSELLGNVNKDWFLQKFSTETRSAERIKLAFQALSSQPEYASQINRDAQYRMLGTDAKTYKDDFEARQQSEVDRFDKLAIKAEKDSGATKELQELLRKEGYNVKANGKYDSSTETSAKEHYENLKNKAAGNISKFDIDTELYNDASNAYLGYALRGAYKKVDMDLIANTSLKWRAEIAQKNEENRIARYAVDREFGPASAPGATVVSGMAQQLPEIQKQYKTVKDQRDNIKKSLDTVVSNSPTFRGWKMENVADAFRKWEQTTGNTDAEKKANFKTLLNQDATHPFTDQQVSQIMEEMNAPPIESSLKSALETFGQAQNQVTRYEEGQGQISSQFITTPEGKEAVKSLRSSNPSLAAGMSDQDLAAKALAQPELFFVRGDSTPYPAPGYVPKSKDSNPAEDFSGKMNRHVNKNGGNYNWGSLGTYEIYANNNDKVLKPTLDGIAKAVETGVGLNFSTFGKTGLYFKDNQGNDLEGETKKIVSMAPGKDSAGKPILKVNATITLSNGKSKDGYTEINMIPRSPEARQVEKGLTKVYANMINSGNIVEAEGVLDNIHALRGNNGLTSAAIDLKAKKLNLNNTSKIPIYTRIQNPDGSFRVVDLSSPGYGWQAADLQDDADIEGMHYKTYGFSTPSGVVLGNVVIDENGNKILVPDQLGGTTYSSSSGIQKARLGKQILSQTPVTVTETRVRTNQNTSDE